MALPDGPQNRQGADGIDGEDVYRGTFHGIGNILTQVYDRHYPDRKGIITGRNVVAEGRDIHAWMYPFYTEHVASLVEQLAVRGKLPSALIDDKGKIRNDILFETIDNWLRSNENGGLLQGVSMFVLGGWEGRFFAALGADVTAYDPSLKTFPPVDEPTLQEVHEKFDETVADKYPERFDVVFSKAVFDTGSSLVEFHYAYPARQMDIYARYMHVLCQITQPGGIAIHTGNMAYFANERLRQLTPEHYDFMGGRTVTERTFDPHSSSSIKIFEKPHIQPQSTS